MTDTHMLVTTCFALAVFVELVLIYGVLKDIRDKK